MHLIFTNWNRNNKTSKENVRQTKVSGQRPKDAYSPCNVMLMLMPIVKKVVDRLVCPEGDECVIDSGIMVNDKCMPI